MMAMRHCHLRSPKCAALGRSHPWAPASRRTQSRNVPKLGDRLRSGPMRGAIFSAHSHFASPGAGQPDFISAAETPA